MNSFQWDSSIRVFCFQKKKHFFDTIFFSLIRFRIRKKKKEKKSLNISTSRKEFTSEEGRRKTIVAMIKYSPNYFNFGIINILQKLFFFLRRWKR